MEAGSVRHNEKGIQFPLPNTSRQVKYLGDEADEYISGPIDHKLTSPQIYGS